MPAMVAAGAMAKKSSPNSILHFLNLFNTLRRRLMQALFNGVQQVFGRQWPPNPEYVRKYGFYFLLLLSTPLFAETLYKVLTHKKRETSTYLEKETQKRMRTLREIINDENLHFLEEEEEAKAKEAKSNGGTSSASDGIKNIQNASAMGLSSGDESDNSDEDDRSDMLDDKHTKIESMVCAIEDVEEIDDEVPVLREAFCLSARMMGREMEDALKKTIAQDDEEFKDGEKLRELIDTSEWLQSKLVGTPWNFEDFYRNPTKYFFGENYMAFTSNNDEVEAFKVAYDTYLRKVHQAADKYMRERERTWLGKSISIVLRFPSEIPLVGVGYLFSVLTGTMSSVSTLYESELINTIRMSVVDSRALKKMKGSVWNIVISMLVAHLVETLFEIYQEKLNNMSQTRMGTKLQQDVFHHILQQDVEYYDLHDNYDAMQYVSTAKNCLFWLLDTPNNLLQKVSHIVTLSVILLNKSSVLFLILMGSRVVQMAARGIVSQYTYRIRKKMRKGNLTKSFNYYELLNPKNFRTVRSFHREPIEHAEFVEQTDMNVENGQKLRVISQVTGPIFQILDRAPEIFALYYGGSLVIAGVLDPGYLVQFVHLGLDCVHEITSIVDGFGDEMYTSLEDVAKVYDLLNRQPKIGLYGGDTPETFLGRINFDNVQFSYPSRKGTRVLRDLTFQAEPGKLTALVGPSGAGKSTVMALLERFYDPSKGSIKLDGVDIRDLNPLWLRKQMAIVPQEPILFNRSIRENMVYGCEDEPPMEEIEEAAKAANIYDFITTKCAEKWRTEVGKGGVRLSGGQKQRLAIARAILKKPKLLLLDEATSALDQESEGLVQEALDRLMEGRTTIAIAHRLSTIRNASKIVCIKDGVVIEEGTHEKLMENGGLYCKYWSEQVGMPHSPAVDSEESSVESDEIEGGDETETKEIATDNEQIEKSTGTKVLRESQASAEASTGDVLNEGSQHNDDSNTEQVDNIGKKPEHLELETKHVNGDTTPPRTPKSSNTQIRQKFIRLQSKYESFIHAAKQGDATALDEIDRIFRDLNFLFNRMGSDIDRDEAFGANSFDAFSMLTTSEPRSRHGRVGLDLEIRVPPPIPLRRTKSYNNENRPQSSMHHHTPNLKRAKTPGRHNRNKFPPVFFDDRGR